MSRLDLRSILTRSSALSPQSSSSVPSCKEPSMIERHLLPGQPKPFSHYCHVVRADRHVWVSGAVGTRKDGTVPDSTVEQFRIALESVDACLRQVGASAAHVVKVTIFMTDISERPLINPLR